VRAESTDRGKSAQCRINVYAVAWHKEDGMAVIFQRNIGMLLLAVWLILSGLAGTMALALPSPLMPVLALLAGILILVGR
jgi:hypothetical protein